MNYPVISEYVDAILSAEDNFDKLVNLRPVLDDKERPVMSVGNFAVVFKMADKTNGRLYAVKSCKMSRHHILSMCSIWSESYP